ncbi:MAG: methylated-DNA--[protein]-cysteine S-methyltransferase [Gammaproteobacteria bacterium]|nr:methylated-DNA--[protein]-cysteine S-methyltransferase [Gammaproteobacteria bacterium]
MELTHYKSPIGVLELLGEDGLLYSIRLPANHVTDRSDYAMSKRNFKPLIEQLDAYFNAELTEFDLPLKPKGTEFEQSVWKALQAIPYADTVSYGDIAEQIGHPSAARAVGAANGKNPIPIVIPCHRVIGANGKLVGFSGGLENKRWLIAHERGERALFDW